MIFRQILILAVFFMLACSANKEQEPWMLNFQKTAINPVLMADSSFVFIDPLKDEPVNWQKADVFNPAAIVRNDTLFVLFRAEDNPDAILGRRTSRIGLAKTIDGLHFEIHPEPVLFPDGESTSQWDVPGGIEDPRIVQTQDGLYVMTYTSWNYDTARLSVATSLDLYHWEKHGPVFQKAYSGRFLDVWSKSGSIVVRLEKDRLVTAKVKGKYWMYWGEDFVNVAVSENLIDWTPYVDEKGELLRVMDARSGFFDSRLVEPGPPALLTEQGILLFYNGKNAEDERAWSELPRGTYSGGQALFDAHNPLIYLDRLDKPFIHPDLPHEISGQYKAGTTFIEGLAFYRGKWFLYYGTADSMVGLAVME